MLYLVEDWSQRLSSIIIGRASVSIKDIELLRSRCGVLLVRSAGRGAHHIIGGLSIGHPWL